MPEDTITSVAGNPIAETKWFRKDLDKTLQELKTASGDGQRSEGTPIRRSRERSLAITKIQEAIMWLGMDLKSINESDPGSAPNPYPQSYDPQSPVISPTSEGLKL